MIYNINDAHIGRSLELYGEWAESEMELLRCVLRPSDVVVDVGSNIGHIPCFSRMLSDLEQWYMRSSLSVLHSRFYAVT